MPSDVMTFAYKLNINEAQPFSGSTLVAIKNVTNDDEILALDAAVMHYVTRSYSARAGDVIRISTVIWGAGNTGGPSPTLQYDSRLYLHLVVPESTSLSVLLCAVAMVRRPSKNRIAGFL